MPRGAPLRLSGGGCSIERGEVVAGQFDLRRLGDLFELRQAGGAGNRRCNAADQPGECDLCRHRLVARGHIVKRLQDARAARVEIFLQPGPTRRISVGIGGRAVLAGEETGGKSIIGDDADVLLPAQRGIAGFEFIAV